MRRDAGSINKNSGSQIIQRSETYWSLAAREFGSFDRDVRRRESANSCQHNFGSYSVYRIGYSEVAVTRTLR
jgi:hypothetical protein